MPAEQPTITDVALCHETFWRHAITAFLSVGTALCSKWVAAECMSQRAARKIDYCPSARVSLVPTLVYSVRGVLPYHWAQMLRGLLGPFLCHCTCSRRITPVNRCYSLNKRLCEPQSDSQEEKFCLRLESNRSRRIAHERSRLIFVTYLESGGGYKGLKYVKTHI